MRETNVSMRAGLALLSLFLLGNLGPLKAQRFHDSDPMLLDNDRLIDVAAEPDELELSDLYDRFGNMLVQLGEPGFTEALNINSLDEVPNSSWFTNRHVRQKMSLAGLAQGANFDRPPSKDEEWYVFRGKSQGVTPGFHIEDSKGDRYVIKFDPPDVPELATAAESIASRIFYALGYNVPQNYTTSFNPDNLKIKEDTLVSDAFGDKVPLTQQRLKRMLRLIPRDDNGKVRATASRYMQGKPIGPFRYFGTRSDDPNDVIPHEHRRELRGLRLFAAWTNHDDTRAQNTQDAWQEAEGKHYIRHYLMDFGSTFGSGSVVIQRAYLGFNYSIDFDAMKYHAPRFGIPVPTYRKVNWPDFPQYQAVGRWSADFFEPRTWRNDYPNPAFGRMTARDAFWAAKILMAFTPEELLAMVKTGEYSDPGNETYFHEVLVERQRKCGNWGINLLNPLDEFRIANQTLRFTNLSEKHGFVTPKSTSYQISWHKYDNQKQQVIADLASQEKQQTSQIPLPDSKRSYPDDYSLLLAEIKSLHNDFPHWADPIRLYLRYSGGDYHVVGIQRTSPAEYIPMR